MQMDEGEASLKHRDGLQCVKSGSLGSLFDVWSRLSDKTSCFEQPLRLLGPPHCCSELRGASRLTALPLFLGTPHATMPCRALGIALTSRVTHNVLFVT